MIGSMTFLDLCVLIALAMLGIALLVTVVRIFRGPTLPDRILALDMLVAIGIGFIAAIGVKTRYYLYIDIAIALGLVGFLATIAFARYVLSRGVAEEEPLESPSGVGRRTMQNRNGSYD